MKKLYTVNSSFIIHFSSAEELEIFANEYRPEIGFYIGKVDDNYRLYSNSRYYYIYPFYADVERKSGIIGINVKKSFPIDQRTTIDLQLNSIRVVGLSPRYLCRSGIQRPQVFPNAAMDLWEFAQRELSSVTREISSDRVKQKQEDRRESLLCQEFLDEHRAIIEEEEKYSRQNLFSFVYSGYASVRQNTMDGVIYRFNIGKSEKQFKSKTKVEIFSEGNERSIAAGNVTEYNSPWLYIKFRPKKGASVTTFSESGIIKECVNVEYPLKLKAIDMLKRQSCANSRFLDIIVLKKLLPLKSDTHYSKEKDPEVRVNDSQIAAIEKALGTEDFLLVQGPPGTGKTTIITEMVKSFVSKGQKVLICSKNNLAVDNVLEKCDDLYYDDGKTKKMQCLRLGDEDSMLPSVRGCMPRPLALSIQDNIKENSERSYESFLKIEKENLRKYNEAYNETYNLCEVLKRFIHMRAVYRNALSLFFDKFFSFILFARRKRMIDKLNHVCATLDSIIASLVSLLSMNSVVLSEPDIKQTVDVVAYLIDKIADIGVEIASAERRYKFVFGTMVNVLSANAKTLSAKKEEILFDMEDILAVYRGNACTEAYSIAVSGKSEIGKNFVDDFRNAVRISIDKAEAVMGIYNTILNEWHGELLCDQQVLEEPLIQCVKIIGATCISVNTTPGFSGAQYDVAIVDEAGQITLHDLIVPLIKAKKIILIGDHVQLAPGKKDDFCNYLMDNDLLEFEDMTENEKREEYLKRIKRFYSVSLFEKLFLDPAFEKNRITLDTQYRMHPVIAEFVSKKFYGGKYYSGVTEKSRSLSIAGFDRPMYFIDTVNSENRAEDKHEDKTKRSNMFEAKICARHIADIIIAIENGEYTGAAESLRDKEGNFDIGVITGYSEQRRITEELIRTYLLREFEDEYVDDIMAHLSVNTLDSFQGRDNQIIFFAFVRSNPQCSIGFLDDIRRVNVMMTRAKSLLVMIGDSKTLTNTRARAVHSGERVSEFFAELIAHCKKHGGYREVKNEGDYE